MQATNTTIVGLIVVNVVATVVVRPGACGVVTIMVACHLGVIRNSLEKFRGLIFRFDQRYGDLLCVIQTCNALIIRRRHHVLIVVLLARPILVE